MQSAMLKAQDMKKGDYFDHTSPTGVDYWIFIKKVDYNYKISGENLAEGFFSSRSVHDAWMDSPGHKENILTPEFEEIGVAVLEIEREGMKSYLAVQHFGRQIKPEDIKVITVCDKDMKEYCKEELPDTRKDLKKTIKKQEDIIDDAEDDGFSKKDLRDLYNNLEDLKDLKDEIDDKLEECDEFMNKCDKWE